MIHLLDESDGITKLTSVILGALTVCLVMVVIGLIVKIKKLQTGTFVAVPLVCECVCMSF